MSADKESLALLPAVGPTALLYIQKKLHGKHYQTLPLDFEQINRFLPFQIEPIQALLEPLISSNNASKILLPNITLHGLLPQMPFDTTKILPLELPPLTGKRVMILGSKYTIDNPFFLKEIDCTYIHPDIPLLERIRHSFYKNGDVDLVNAFMQTVSYDSVDQVLIACSELSCAFEKQSFHAKKIDLLTHLF
ncbi:MAG: hypothetical protein SP1CHLAM54_16920 [Chlamydiia bacterium]|nr:hypothetical protein [Chlamydiia bacterium]MCH9616580.1 hypothetical protein [Chlamydiia bacterium]MCH9629310.1 hypothetical protein [Chlamydiia bacterium]